MNNRGLKIESSRSLKIRSSWRPRFGLLHLDNLMPPCVSEEENMDLSRIPSPEEIKATMFQMQDLKAPGLDGFPALFYKEFWSMVGKTIVQVVTSFFIDASMPSEIAIKTSDLIDSSTRSWIRGWVNVLFTPADANAILSILIPYNPKQERLIWIPDSKGRFFVKSVHKVAFTSLERDSQPQAFWLKLWKAKFSESVDLASINT
nr:hypothetical protein CFP56_06276 [Quercus suber]